MDHDSGNKSVQNVEDEGKPTFVDEGEVLESSSEEVDSSESESDPNSKKEIVVVEEIADSDYVDVPITKTVPSLVAARLKRKKRVSVPIDSLAPSKIPASSNM